MTSSFLFPLSVCLSFPKAWCSGLEPHGPVEASMLWVGLHGGGYLRRVECIYQEAYRTVSFRALRVPGLLPRP